MNGTFIPWDDNQVLDVKILMQVIHALFNQRARSTITSGEELINAILALVSNVAGMNIHSLPTLQRMATFGFPKLTGKEHIDTFLRFRDTTAKTLLPGLLSITHDASDTIHSKFQLHQDHFRRVHDMNRQVVVSPYFTHITLQMRYLIVLFRITHDAVQSTVPRSLQQRKDYFRKVHCMC